MLTHANLIRKLFGHDSNNIGNFFTNHVNVQVWMYGGMKCVEGFCVYFMGSLSLNKKYGSPLLLFGWDFIIRMKKFTLIEKIEM
jgi:hypothetical protein